MEYKELYEQLQSKLWNGGLLDRIYDPFHNEKGNLKTDEMLDVIDTCHKFADKLYEETNDEYVIKMLFKICEFVGETYLHGDVSEVAGTKYDPQYMFCEYKSK